MLSQEAEVPQIQPDCDNSLWQVTLKDKQENISDDSVNIQAHIPALFY